MKVLIDANVILDYILSREPEAAYTEQILSAGIKL